MSVCYFVYLCGGFWNTSLRLAKRLKPLPAGRVNYGNLDNLCALAKAGCFGVQDQDIVSPQQVFPFHMRIILEIAT